jgi:hypothetical protein
MASLSQLWLGQSIMLVRRSRARFHRLGDGRRGTANRPMIQSTNANIVNMQTDKAFGLTMPAWPVGHR